MRSIFLKHFYIIIIVFVVLLIKEAAAQNSYATRKGTVIVTAKYGDSTVGARSGDLIVKLDYNKAKLKMSVSLSTFQTGIDSLNRKIQALEDTKIIFDGKLGLDFINTHTHPVQNFDFTGILSGKSKRTIITGKGKLQHIIDNSEIVSCILWLDFKLDTRKLKWDLNKYGIDENIEVEIIQAVLNRI